MERKTIGRNDGCDSKSLLSGKDENRDHCLSEETANVEENLDSFVKKGRYLSHELNNLLTTILANTQLMMLVLEDAELKDYLETVEDATREAGVLVHDFQGSIRQLRSSTSQEHVSSKI